MAITQFMHKGLERFFSQGTTAAIQPAHANRLRLLRGLSLMSPSRMHQPPHPGEILRELCLEPLNLSVTDAAASLGVSRNTLSSILNGRAGISPEMAIRLSIAFDTTAESWLQQQLQYDLWRAEQSRKRLRVRRLSAA